MSEHHIVNGEAWGRLATGASLAILTSMGLGCPLKLPPHYLGKLYCFTADNAYGRDVDSGQFRSIHRNGEPVKVCWCYCDELHADTQLFTGENPPDAAQTWLDWIAEDRARAVDQCKETAATLGIVDDNCEDVVPLYPTWEQQDGECAAKPFPEGEYCTEPDPSADDGDSSGEPTTGEETTGPEIGVIPMYSDELLPPRP